MGCYKAQDKKLVVLHDAGSIPELNYICGPILNPCKLPIETIQKLVINKRTVYECNPNNTNERIRLTTRNVKKNNFKLTFEEGTPIITIKPKMIYGGNVDIEPIVEYHRPNINSDEKKDIVIPENIIDNTNVNIESIANNDTAESETDIKIDNDVTNNDLLSSENVTIENEPEFVVEETEDMNMDDVEYIANVEEDTSKSEESNDINNKQEYNNKRRNKRNKK